MRDRITLFVATIGTGRRSAGRSPTAFKREHSAWDPSQDVRIQSLCSPRSAAAFAIFAILPTSNASCPTGCHDRPVSRRQARRPSIPVDARSRHGYPHRATPTRIRHAVGEDAAWPRSRSKLTQRRAAGVIATHRGLPYRWQLWLLLLPYLAGLTLLVVIPALVGLPLAFTEFNALQPPAFTGLDNLIEMRGDPIFWKSVFNSACLHRAGGATQTARRAGDGAAPPARHARHRRLPRRGLPADGRARRRLGAPLVVAAQPRLWSSQPAPGTVRDSGSGVDGRGVGSPLRRDPDDALADRRGVRGLPGWARRYSAGGARAIGQRRRESMADLLDGRPAASRAGPAHPPLPRHDLLPAGELRPRSHPGRWRRTRITPRRSCRSTSTPVPSSTCASVTPRR